MLEILLFRFFGVTLPDYPIYEHPDMGDVKAVPVPWWRRIAKRWPYYVAQRVEFELRVEKEVPRSPMGNYKFRIYEVLNDQQRHIHTIQENKTRIRGNIINRQGDLEYRVVYDDAVADGAVIFQANVISRDQIWQRWWWLIISLLITLPCTCIGWLLALLQLFGGSNGQ